MFKSFKELKEEKDKKQEGKVVELPDTQEVLEVSTEPTDTKIEKENKTSFEEFKVLYKGQIDDKCLEDYGTIEDKKLWEDTAKELFMASEDYIPDEEDKAEKIEESKSDRYQVREFDGPGAKFGVYDTKEKKFVQKGSKYVMDAACKELNEKGKVTESSIIKNTLKEMMNKKQESIDFKFYEFDITIESDNDFNTIKNIIDETIDEVGGTLLKISDPEIKHSEQFTITLQIKIPFNVTKNSLNKKIEKNLSTKIDFIEISEYREIQPQTSLNESKKIEENVKDDLNKAREDSKRKGLYCEADNNLPDFTGILDNYDWDVDIVTKDQLGSDYYYRTLCTTVNDAERFNYHSDYWGDADTYQQDNIDLMEQVEPYVGKEVIVNFDDGSQKFKILGIVIDKQYNSLSHTCILAEELGEIKTEDHQLYYDDIQGMPTSERHDLWKQYHEEDFEDSEEGNNKFWDWAEEEFPVKELNESKLQEDQYESERRRGVPPIKRIAEQEVYDNEEWYKKHINDYLDITDFVNRNIKEIAAEYNLRDTKAAEACKKIYEIAIELNDKKEEAVEEEINVTDADKDINSVMVTYISNQTFMKYYNLEKPITEDEIKNIKLKIKNHEMYVTDIADKLGAIEVNSKKELIPNTYIMKIKENDVEDLEESKQDKCVMCGNDNLDGCFVVKSNSICKDCGKKYSLDEIENKISNKRVKTESQVSDYTFKELNKVINDKGNDFKIQISGSEDKTNWLNIDKEDLQAIYQALQNKKAK